MIRAKDVIPAVLADVVRKAPLCAEKVDFAWRVAVGPAVQRATAVRLDDDGVLHVTAATTQWGGEVRRSSKLILARLETMLGVGVVKKIRT